MSVTTYSFEDIICTLNHSSIGSKSTKGEGLGSITIAMTNDRTVHDTASDGSIMITKKISRNGTIVIDMQQTSQLHKWLLKAYNYLDNAATSEWALMTVTIVSKELEENTTCTNVSFQKIANKPYQAEGQHVSWTLMAAKIIQE